MRRGETAVSGSAALSRTANLWYNSSMPEDVQWIEDAPSGLQAVLVIDMLVAGRSFGGIRLGSYAHEMEALADAKKLARAMSLKCAFAGIDGGGAKTVVWGWRDRGAAMRALGRHIQGLAGRYLAGADMGFTDDDAAAVKAETKHLACCDVSDATGRSVVDALDAASEKAGVPLKSVAVQGAGAVGWAVVRRLRERGIAVVVGEPDPPRAERARQAGCEVVFPDAIYQQAADAFSPCARGGVLSDRAAVRLKCRIVCGGANNPLVNDAVAKVLHDRGILYVPDFVANAGALIQGSAGVMGHDPEPLLAALPGRVRELLDLARAENKPPLDVAVRIAEERLRRA